MAERGKEINAEKRLLTRMPGECDAKDLGDFLELVRAGSEVSPEGLEDRIRRASWLFFLLLGDCLVGIAALKRPNESYRTYVAGCSGVSVKEEDYPYELGWVFVTHSARGHKYSTDLTRAAVAVSGGKGIFATSSTENRAMHASLRKCGFSAVGKAYASERGEHTLQVFTRRPGSDATDPRASVT